MILLIVSQLWLSFMTPWDRANGTLLFGNWQSCSSPESGEFEERIYEHRLNGKLQWSLHMGPKDEFGLYHDAGPDGPDHHHDVGNLLGPAYRINDVQTWGGKRNWTVPSLKLHINIIGAMGSKDECESFVVKIERTRPF